MHKIFEAADCKEYTEVRLLKKLHSTIQKMLEIVPVEKVAAEVGKQRYQYEWLRDKPHILTLRAIFELQEIMDRMLKYGQV